MKVLVTGASRGIGAAIATRLAADSHDLVLHASRVENLAGTVEACRVHGARVEPVAADLANEDEVEELARINVDMLVNNAGVSGTEKLPWEITPAEFRRTLEVNLLAPFMLSTALIRSGGTYIVDLSSGAAVTDRDVSADYWGSKTALMRLAGSIDLASPVKIFSLAPGVVRTDMTEAMKMHRGRTEWTDVAEVADIVAAIAAGSLDGLAGAHLRAGTDTLSDLLKRSQDGIDLHERRLRLTPWNRDDSGA